METKTFTVDLHTERFLQLAMKVENNVLSFDDACNVLQFEYNPHCSAYCKIGQEYAKEILFYACLDSEVF